MKITLFMAVILSVYLTTNLQAQTTGKTASTQTATTDDGRRVVLKSNKTWEYVAPSITKEQQTKQSKAKATSILSIEAGFDLKSDDASYLEPTEFYILDNSLVDILRNDNINTPSIYGRRSDQDYLSDFANASKFPNNPDYRVFHLATIKALTPHIIQRVTTDSNGKARFAPVAAGTYYIMGVGSTPGSIVINIWNIKVVLKDGENPLVLDENSSRVAL